MDVAEAEAVTTRDAAWNGLLPLMKPFLENSIDGQRLRLSNKIDVRGP
jgi:hypothetical protein